MKPKLLVTRLPHLNTIVIRQEDGGRFFISAPNVFIIDTVGMSLLIKFMLMHGFISKRVLQGILEECEEANDRP